MRPAKLVGKGRVPQGHNLLQLLLALFKLVARLELQNGILSERQQASIAARAAPEQPATLRSAANHLE
jgi:hypothetical protein